MRQRRNPPRKKEKAGTKEKEEVVDLQTSATQSAWPVPIRTLSAVLLGPLVALLLHVGSLDSWIGIQLLVCSALSLAAYFVTSSMIPLIADKLVDKLYGIDIGKRGLGGPRDGERVPESCGIVSSMVFMICLGALQFIFGTSNDQLLEYNAALLSICFATLLGLVDDIIDIKWRHKLPVALMMTLPLLMSYKGETSILVPKALSPLLSYAGAQDQDQPPLLTQLLHLVPTVQVDPSGRILELGMVYYLYMAMLGVFCTNAINIYAGINGLEVGQSIVIACSIAVMNLSDLAWRGGGASDILSGDGRNHLFSLMMMLPFIATSAALLRFNFYPAKVFVGDVYPYYAGMCFAVAAILGHFSKSLLLLVIPQIANFLYSLPQLFFLVPIPRHRLPRINLETGFLDASKVAQGDDRSNMTLLCLALDLFGSMHERTLCVVLLVFQAICGVFGILVRRNLNEMVF